MEKKKSNVLVVEDNRDIQRIYYRILAGPYNLFQAYDTKEAWKILARGDIDLLVLDIILPKGKHGDQFFMQLSQHPEYQVIPVIFVTVVDDQQEAEEFKNINNAVWITKPFKEDELLQKVREMLSKKSETKDFMTG
jgi:DNA-binding response OmpR family regulator